MVKHCDDRDVGSNLTVAIMVVQDTEVSCVMQNMVDKAIKRNGNLH